MIEYFQIFWLLAAMEYPKDSNINLFDHTKFDISINQNDSLSYTIMPIGPLADQIFVDHVDAEVELELLNHLSRQDSINQAIIEYYPDFDPNADPEPSTNLVFTEYYYDSSEELTLQELIDSEELQEQEEEDQQEQEQ